MKPIETVITIAEEIIAKAKYVSINDAAIAEVAGQIGQAGSHKWGPPKGLPSGISEEHIVAYELEAAAVNYRYWYCRHDIRPGGAGAELMYNLLAQSFTLNNCDYGEEQITEFIRLMAANRFPAIEERSRHLTELVRYMPGFVQLLANPARGSLEDWLDRLIAYFPGFAADIFLKRAFLFFMMLNRRLGYFAEDIATLPIPADYQIPKMLEWLGMIKYTKGLKNKIISRELIPAGGQEECEIRAASILACRELARKANCTMNDIDSYLWIRRRECNIPFHLTITTDY